MKKNLTPALLAAVMLSGCAGGSTEARPAEDTTPRPDAAQRAALTKSFKSVAPELGTSRSVEDAISICRLIRSGAPDDVQARRVSAAYRLDQGRPLADKQVTLVLAAIKDNGFCTPA